MPLVRRQGINWTGAYLLSDETTGLNLKIESKKCSTKMYVNV